MTMHEVTIRASNCERTVPDVFAEIADDYLAMTDEQQTAFLQLVMSSIGGAL